MTNFLFFNFTFVHSESGDGTSGNVLDLMSRMGHANLSWDTCRSYHLVSENDETHMLLTFDQIFDVHWLLLQTTIHNEYNALMSSRKQSTNPTQSGSGLDLYQTRDAFLQCVSLNL